MAMDLVLGTVDLSDETIAELTRNSEYAARVLRNMRDKVADAAGERNSITAARVLNLIDGEIEAYDAGTNPAAWRKSVPAVARTDGADNPAMARTAARRQAVAAQDKPVKDTPQA